MTKVNPPVNIFLGKSVEDLAEGKYRMLYRDQLAEKLGVSPKERVSMAVVNDGNMVYISCLVDGGDLTPGQEEIFRKFIEETGAAKVIGSFPEKPTTS